MTETGPTSAELISRSDEVLGGTPVFRGTRVPVRTLVDYLAAGQSLDEFLEDFPTVPREDAVGVLELAAALVLHWGVRVLLDECLPRRLKGAFGPDHEVTTVPERGWAGTRNGALLQLASDVVDVFVTIDAGLPYQQDLGRLPLAIVLLIAPSNRLDALLPLVPGLLEQLSDISPGQVLRVGSR